MSATDTGAGGYHIARYGRTRFWAVMHDDQLVAVVVYLRGARELLRHLAGL